MPVIRKIKNTYILWHECHSILPKTHKYSFGNRIDELFVEAIESTVSAIFLVGQEKAQYVRAAIRKVDTLKVLLLLLWETKSLNDNRYAALSEKIDEVGRMLGGWSGQLAKQNSPARAREK